MNKENLSDKIKIENILIRKIYYSIQESKSMINHSEFWFLKGYINKESNCIKVVMELQNTNELSSIVDVVVEGTLFTLDAKTMIDFADIEIIAYEKLFTHLQSIIEFICRQPLFHKISIPNFKELKCEFIYNI